MRLTSNILIRILLPVALIVALWSVGFYFAIINEINDEVDDALEQFAEDITRRCLAGEPMPEGGDGSNNTYRIEHISSSAVEYSSTFSDEEVWIASKSEMEPARVLRTTFTDNEGRGYMLTVLTPTIEKEDLRESLMFWAALLCLSLIILITIIIVVVLHKSLRPLHRLLGWLDSNRFDGDRQPLTNPTSIYEFSRLNDAVTEYDRHNRALFEQQKEFIGNASHEMQTPLAICTNRLDLLTDTTLSEAQLGEIAKVQNTLKHLSRLNSSLLLLTKIESGQFHDTEMLNIGDLIREKLEDLKDIFGYKNISVNVVETTPLIVEMERSLADIATMNLLKNAFIHNVNGGSIEVRISSEEWSVSNTGAAEPLDKNRIFTRFYQSNKREGSTGLGLAITASVARAYGFEPRYLFADSRHIFTMSRR